MILVLDAATSTVVAGLCGDDGRILSERRLEGGRGDVIPGLLDQLLAETGTEPSTVTRVVCGVGPGSFTGIRIALSFAHGFAFRRSLPLIGVSSLEAALSHPSLDPSRPRVALLDALRGEAYVRRLDPGSTDSVDHRLPLDRLSDVLAGDPQVVAEGKPDFLAALPPGWRPLREVVSAAGLSALRDGAGEPLPNYLRLSTPEEKRAEG
jgi:tRNA threonylcarbamoyladenosine biosynthesis protein TsaB